MSLSPSPGAPVVAMEEHCEAYFAWKSAGIRDGWCWHVDAHLDLGRDGLDPATLTGLAACLSYGEAEQRGLCGNAYLPWGGLHCGNYLYPAIREGIVSRLTWVVPPGLVEGRLLPWARGHLDGWLDLSVREFAGLEEKDGYLRGTLLGIPFWLGTAERLPPPDQPVLLDLDLDYFLTPEGQVWQDPTQLPRPDSRFTTLAYSVKGGYTPAAQRCLAATFLPGWEDGYQGTALDEAAALYRQHRYLEVLPRLAELRLSEPIVCGYLAGSSYYQLEQYQSALEEWQAIGLRPELPRDGRAYLGGLCAEVLCRLQRPQEAQACAQEALQEAPGDYRLYWAGALALEALGDVAAAARLVRRGLRLAEDYVFGLRMRLVLARLYRSQGKQGLAAMELQRLERDDLTGQLRPLTLLR